MSTENKISSFSRVYFLGIGGIGMSALAKYFLSIGKKVAGYDKTPSDITDELKTQGAEVHFEDDTDMIPVAFLDQSTTLIVRTPAVPADHSQWNLFQNNGFTIMKRAEVLGMISKKHLCLGVAGTHGKTTTSTLLAHMLQVGDQSFNAFLGGISSNFGTNFVSNDDAKYTVIEADEFDRSFLQLRPYASIITSCDPDHLDIYGDSDTFLQGFRDYADLISSDGFAVIRYGLPISTKTNAFTYGIDEREADFIGTNVHVNNGKFIFDLEGKELQIQNLEVGLPGIHNIENALACAAVCFKLGMDENQIREGLRSFRGVKRRFEIKVNRPGCVYIDDYAHHPTAIKVLIDSVKLLHPGKKILGIFQPHLFTRTRDFLPGFIEELSRLNECLLLDIYPARELPIEGITSQAISEKLSTTSAVIQKSELLDKVKTSDFDVLLTIGAGDIDRFVNPLTNLLSE